MFKALNPDLANWSITEFVDSFRFGSFKLVTVVHFDFWFLFFIGLVFFQGIIMWGEGVY